MGIKIQILLHSLVTKKSNRFQQLIFKKLLILMIISLISALNLKIFSPREPLGILILVLGLIFTGMIFYIIYAVSTNKESLEDKKIRTKRESLQQEKIGKLFPKKK